MKLKKIKGETKRSGQECKLGRPSVHGPYLIFFSFSRGRLFFKKNDMLLIESNNMSCVGYPPKIRS